MDPICHTLFGSALAHAGLKRRTVLGTATLVIGANLPDIDMLAYLDGPAAALGFRRGWTHGVLALTAGPLILTGLILLWDRAMRHRRGGIDPPAVRPKQVLLLAFISILSHPVLDTLNTYGVRWLMPFSGRWFYGDTLFIADPWVWLVLAAGIGLTVRQERVRRHGAKPTNPARLALALCTGYILVMAASNLAGRRFVAAELAAPFDGLMLAPEPLNPLFRTVIARSQGQYLRGRLDWLSGGSLRMLDAVPIRPPETLPDLLRETLGTPPARAFLSWARFPLIETDDSPGRSAIHLVDLRYAAPGDRHRFGVVSVAASGSGRAARQ